MQISIAININLENICHNYLTSCCTLSCTPKVQLLNADKTFTLIYCRTTMEYNFILKRERTLYKRQFYLFQDILEPLEDY